MHEFNPKIPWISVKDRLPINGKPRIVYGRQMFSHYPGIAYAKYIGCKNQNDSYWKNCFSYGGETFIRMEEVDFWLDIDLPL